MTAFTTKANPLSGPRPLQIQKSLGRRHLLWALSALIILVLFLIGVRLLTPYSPEEICPEGTLAGISLSHPLGTDHLARDILTRIAYGAFPSFALAALSIVFAIILGFTLGALSAYGLGPLSWLSLRLIDLLFAFPSILSAMLFAAILGSGFRSCLIALSLAFAPSFARVIRSSILQHRQENFILRLELAGAKPIYLLVSQFLPLIFRDLLTAIGIGLANAILAESTLSYLGIGLPQRLPSWGRMLKDAQSSLYYAPQLLLAPAAFLIYSVLVLFALSDALATIQAERQRQRQDS
ncbi:MAG: ABC transporter permease [Eubacteriales bacterium]|nr:ABC transporter permease [Eubacteriales bacterium]